MVLQIYIIFRDVALSRVAIQMESDLSILIIAAEILIESFQHIWWHLSHNIFRIQESSFAQIDNTMYSASADESATIVWLLFLQYITEELMLIINPVVELRY